ncbi:uncharacterized protein TNCV_289531 [Trichonephila clavipes]|nr:uncharacterized protein TNCV_289531 [Trichonephila clavipes]
MDVCKCIVPSQHGGWGTLNSRGAACPLVWLEKGEENWVAPDHPQGVLSQSWSGNAPKRNVACKALKATVNDRCTFLLQWLDIPGWVVW